MKKTILSPICSALIIPGLGQVINGSLKKGLVLLALVFLLFLGATLKLLFLFRSLLVHSETLYEGTNPDILTFQGEFLSSLYIFIIPFAILWIYSLFDAFWTGRKLEKGAERKDNDQCGPI